MTIAAIEPQMFSTIAGIWAFATIAILISAIRLCYAIEKRSRSGHPKGSLPRYANIFPVAFNFGVATDEETQRMRKRMNWHLLAIVSGVALFATFVSVTIPDRSSLPPVPKSGAAMRDAGPA